LSTRTGRAIGAAAADRTRLKAEVLAEPGPIGVVPEFFSVKLWWRCVLRARSGLSLTASG
jgi:hypothetical protein